MSAIHTKKLPPAFLLKVHCLKYKWRASSNAMLLPVVNRNLITNQTDWVFIENYGRSFGLLKKSTENDMNRLLHVVLFDFVLFFA